MASKTAPDLSTLSPTPGNDLWNNVVIRSSICDLLDTSTLTRLARLDRSTFASSVRYFWSGETESFGTDERLDKVKDAGRRRIYADAVRSIRASHFGDVDQSLLERWILQYPNVVNIHNSTAKSHFRLRAQRDRSHRIVSFHCIQGVLNDSRASAMLYSNLAGIRQVVPAVYGATGILNGLVIIDKGDEDALDQIIAKYDIVLGRVVISSMLLVSDAAARTSLEKFLARTGVVDVTIRIEEERNEWGPVLNSGNHAHARLALDSARLIITRQRIASIQGLRCPLHEAMNLILEYSDIFRALESLGISAHTYMGLQRILDVKMPDFEDRALGSTSTSPMLVDLTIRCDTEIGFPGEGAQLYYPRHAAVIEQIARMLLHVGGSAVRFCIQGSADTTGSARDEGAVWQCQSGVMPLQKWVGIRVRSLIAVAQWKARDAMRDQVDEEAIGLD